MPGQILFLPQIDGRKRICDRRCPDVVSGRDIVVRGKKRREGAASHRPGHLVNSILMCFSAPPTGIERPYPRRGLAGAVNDAAYVSPCVSRTPCTHKRLLPLALASAPVKCVHRASGLVLSRSLRTRTWPLTQSRCRDTRDYSRKLCCADLRHEVALFSLTNLPKNLYLTR